MYIFELGGKEHIRDANLVWRELNREECWHFIIFQTNDCAWFFMRFHRIYQEQILNASR